MSTSGYKRRYYIEKALVLKMSGEWWIIAVYTRSLYPELEALLALGVLDQCVACKTSTP